MIMSSRERERNARQTVPPCWTHSASAGSSALPEQRDPRRMKWSILGGVRAVRESESLEVCGQNPCPGSFWVRVRAAIRPQEYRQNKPAEANAELGPAWLGRQISPNSSISIVRRAES